MIDKDDTLTVMVDGLSRSYRDLATARNNAEFDAALAQIILDGVHRLETDSKGFSKLGEDALTSILVGYLNGTEVLVVTREENSNGHVDMTFKAHWSKPPRLAQGEAKVFNYYPTHEKGLNQLINRYSTGREERGLLLSYVKIKEIKKHFVKLREQMDEKRPCEQVAACGDHSIDNPLEPTRWSFVSKHTHSSGECVEVWHLGCNVYHPDAKLSEQSV